MTRLTQMADLSVNCVVVQEAKLFSPCQVLQDYGPDSFFSRYTYSGTLPILTTGLWPNFQTSVWLSSNDDSRRERILFLFFLKESGNNRLRGNTRSSELLRHQVWCRKQKQFTLEWDTTIYEWLSLLFATFCLPRCERSLTKTKSPILSNDARAQTISGFVTGSVSGFCSLIISADLWYSHVSSSSCVQHLDQASHQ